MGRRRNKKKKKNSQRNAASQNVTTPASPASKPAANDTEVKATAEPAAVVATATANAKSPVTPVAPDAPWESWPPLQDRGQNPVRLPYDHGGIPLLLLLFYMTFLGFAMTYMANWLVPDLLNYFFTE